MTIDKPPLPKKRNSAPQNNQFDLKDTNNKRRTSIFKSENMGP